jgi:predicted component of type VI protein secretion system
MSSPRLALFILPLALGLPLLTGGCGAPVAVAAASYGADGVSLAESGKTTGDHFTSMVSKKDCALWRVLRNQKVCREREGDRDPYQVNYNEPFRDQSEGGGVEYHPPLRAAPDAPVTSWDAATYKPAPAPTSPPAQPVTAVADATPTPAPEPAIAAPPPSKAKKPKGDHSMAKKKVKKVKPSPDQAAAVP